MLRSTACGRAPRAEPPAAGRLGRRQHYRPRQPSQARQWLPALPFRRTSAVRIGDLAQDRGRMTPFAVQQVWRAGRPAPVSEKGSTLALLLEATVQRVTAAATSATGCLCCRCSTPLRRTADLQSVTVAVARSDLEEFRALARVYCAHCAPDTETAEAMAAREYRAMVLRFRIRVPPSKAWKPSRKHPAGAAAC
jgi:hypothetical protein